MKIAFYSPLKSPNHPVPSGDRLMARMLMTALRRVGHEVVIASELRSFSADPHSQASAQIDTLARQEAARLSALWNRDGKPDLWFCYHPYYKAPDLIGPSLSRTHGVAYVTAEASYSARRNTGLWARSQAQLLKSVTQAAVNICFTSRDRDGLLSAAPAARLAMLKPFIDPTPFLAAAPQAGPHRLITVAMMRSGDKMDSYRMLACALALLADLPWTLSIVGDGPMSA